LETAGPLAPAGPKYPLQALHATGKDRNRGAAGNLQLLWTSYRSTSASTVSSLGPNPLRCAARCTAGGL